MREPVLRASRVVPTAALFLLVGLLGGPAALPGTVAAVAHPSGAAGSCPGSYSTASMTGRLAYDHPFGATPVVGNRTIVVNYSYQETFSGPSSPTYRCIATNLSVPTATNGTFLVQPPIPAGNCTGVHHCQVNSGPFGPYRYRVVGGDPAGDLLRVGYNGSTIRLTWTSAFADLRLSPVGPLTVSTGDVVSLTASPWAGDGQPSPANVSYGWGVTGSGWRTDDTSGASTAVVAADGAGPGTAALSVNATYNGTVFPTVRRSVLLTAVTTTIANASVAPSAIDAEQSVSVALSGSGAAGYTYTGSVSPGDGSDPVALACASSSSGSPTVAVLCRATLAYPSPGTVQPVVNLTNGHSEARWDLPSVRIAPAMGITLGPDPAAGYPGLDVPFFLSVRDGTGTGPFGPACLAPGDGGSNCTTSFGPDLPIRHAYLSVGTYTASGWVVDGTGANRSATVPVTIADRPHVPATLGGCPTGVVEGSRVLSLTSDLSGGLWPAAYWWNDSRPNATLALGFRTADGPLEIPWNVSLVGDHVLTLTVVDALGTRVASTCRAVVVTGPAVAVTPVDATPLPSLPAGRTENVSFRAIDAAGATVPSFAALVELRATGPAAPGSLALVDAAGPLALSTQGFGEVPASAWDAGRLNLTFAATRSGLWNLTLVPGVGWPIHLAVPVVADGAEPRLVDPVVASSSDRGGATQYDVVDPYGNAVLGGYVIVRAAFAVGTVDTDAGIQDHRGIGRVWVNYSALDGGRGVIYVLSASGVQLLAPAIVPAAAVAPDPGNGMLAVAGLLVIGSAAGVAIVRHRFRRPRPGPEPEVEEPELARHAAGRDHLLRRLSEGAGVSLPDLAEGWTGPAPAPTPSEISEWLSTLVADGNAVARSDPLGRPIFLLATPPDDPPPLYLDESTLERALSSRAGTDEDPDPDGRP